MKPIARLIVGLVFLASAFSKIGALGSFHKSLLLLPLMPNFIATILVLGLPSLELVVGLCLTFDLYRSEASAIAVVMLAGFFVFTITMAIYHPKTICSCVILPPAFEKYLTGWRSVGKNALLLALISSSLLPVSRLNRIRVSDSIIPD